MKKRTPLTSMAPSVVLVLLGTADCHHKKPQRRETKDMVKMVSTLNFSNLRSFMDRMAMTKT